MEWAKSSKTSMSVLQTNVYKGLRTRLKEVLSTAVAFDALWVCVSETGTMPEYLELDSYIFIHLVWTYEKEQVWWWSGHHDASQYGS